MTVPDHGGLALIGDANGRHFGRLDALRFQDFTGHAHLAAPYLHGIMLDPAGGRVMLPELFLGDAHNLGVSIEEDGAAASGALIERQDVFFFHEMSPSFYRVIPDFLYWYCIYQSCSDAVFGLDHRFSTMKFTPRHTTMTPNAIVMASELPSIKTWR